MKNNSFIINGAKISIESGFMPFGRDYTALAVEISRRIEKIGSFKMEFNNSGNHSVGKLLTVNYSKK